jgi:YfiH family protein
VVDRPWAAVHQVHGSKVVVVGEPSDDLVEADALVTDRTDVVLSVNVADCAPIALYGDGPVIGAVHAGWRGLELGVVEETASTMRSLGAHRLHAWLGPCIHPECYEFGEAELDRLSARFGPAVRATTSSGQPALDVPMAVAAALGRAGVRLVDGADACTACDPLRFYSHRRGRDTARHALAVWMDQAP